MTPHMSISSATRTITRTFSTMSFQVFEPLSCHFNLNVILVLQSTSNKGHVAVLVSGEL